MTVNDCCKIVFLLTLGKKKSANLGAESDNHSFLHINLPVKFLSFFFSQRIFIRLTVLKAGSSRSASVSDEAGVGILCRT
jgi:hypothetical protein